MQRMRLICTEGGANKFWEATVEGEALTVRFGKVGTAGQTKTKSFATTAAAQAELAKLVAEKRKKGYVEEQGSSAGSAVGPRTMARHGIPPGDWHEGPRHPFEVCFAAVPTAGEKAQIAALFEKALAKGHAEPATEAWLWTGPWAFFEVDERDADDEDDDEEERSSSQLTCDTIRAVGKAFEQIDRKVPVAQLAFLGLIALKHGDQVEPAGEGPEWDGDYNAADRAYGRVRVDPDPAPAFDPAFEAARAEAAGRKATAGVACPIEFKAVRAKRPKTAPEIVKAFGAGFSEYRCWRAAGQTLAIVQQKLWVLADGQTTARAIVFPGQKGRIDDVAVRLDGKLARVQAPIEDATYGSLPAWFELELPEGRPRRIDHPPVFQAHTSVSPEFVRDGRLLYTGGCLMVLCAADGKTEIARLEFAPTKAGHKLPTPWNVLVCLDGRAAVCALDTDTHQLCVVAIGKDRLVEIGRSDRFRCDEPFEKDGRVFAGGQELVNLRALLVD